MSTQANLTGHFRRDRQPYPRGPWSLEGEVYLRKIGFDPNKPCIEVHANGFVIGYWVDSEWDGHGPIAELIHALPDLVDGCYAALAYLADPRSKFKANRDAATETIRGALRKAGFAV